jgi:hypothetical protein
VITVDEKYINAEASTRLLDNCPKDEEVVKNECFKLMVIIGNVDQAILANW